MAHSSTNCSCRVSSKLDDLGQLKYSFGIEVARSQSGIYLSQRKYVLDLQHETGMLGSKPVDTPMDQHTKLIAHQDELLADPGR